MSAVKGAWIRIQNWCAKNVPDLQLSPGCSRDDLKRLEAALGLKLPKSVNESYLIHNGQNDVASFPYGRMLLSVEGIEREWRRMCELWRVDTAEEEDDLVDGAVKRKNWSANWIPFLSNDSGEYCFLDFDPGTLGSNGQVVDFSHEEGPVRLLGSSFEDFLLGYASALESGKYVYDEGWICAADTTAFEKEEQEQRLTWAPRKKLAAKGKRAAAREAEPDAAENLKKDAVAFLNRFLLATREWRHVFCKAKKAEIDAGKIDKDTGRNLMFDELRSIYRLFCRYSTRFPFGFIEDAPFTDPECSKIMSVTEAGNTTTVVVQPPTLTNEKLQYAIVRTRNGFKVAARDTVEDTRNPEAIAFLRRFIGAMGDAVAEGNRMGDLAKQRNVSWDDYFKFVKDKAQALHDAWCPASEKQHKSESMSLYLGGDPRRYQILNVAEKGKKITIVFKLPRDVFVGEPQKLISLEEWLDQDPARVDDLYSAGGLFRDVMQATLVRSEDGLRIADVIKKYIEYENRFVPYIHI